MELRKIFSNLKLDKEGAAELERALALPEIQAILSREEEQQLNRRRSLIIQIETAPKRHAGAVAKACEAADRARRKVAGLEASLQMARDELVSAANSELAAQTQAEREVRAAEAQLRDGRDRRLDDLYMYLDTCDDIVRNLYQIWPSLVVRVLGRNEVTYADNNEEVKRVRIALAAAKRDIQQLVLAAVSRVEVTQRMTAICAAVTPLLYGLGVAAPEIAELGEVKPPAFWKDRSTLNDKIERLATKAA